jgi:septum formation protein
MEKNRLILASTSPRRREILGYFGLPFDPMSSGVDETEIVDTGDPSAFAIEAATRKAAALAEWHPERPILAADTVVFFNGRLFQKPESLSEAHAMLRALSGNWHEVYTAVTFITSGTIHKDVEISRVLFHELTDSEIHAYHRAFDPLDKAGGYTIQKAGALIVKSIEGCYYNVMGLPLGTTCRLLLNGGIDLWHALRPIC